VTLAAKPAHLRSLEAARRLLAQDFDYPTELLGPAEIGREIGSTRYHGGLVDPLAGALQPVAYVVGLAAAALRAGARIAEHTTVTRLARSGERMRIDTTRGTVAAGEVLVATNGYTARLTRYLARRLVPVGSFIVATAPLGADVARRLIPNDRMLSDTRNLLYYFRLSPDHRLVFGGRAAFVPTALERSVALLVQGIGQVYPELRGVRIEHAWGGTLGFTLDHLPHIGRHEGITHAVGYGGHGVAMASWLGDRAGRALGGSAQWPALAGIPFPAVPLYCGRPWFLPLAGAYYGLKDRLR
jgi:glycine/D-amino acid oxidase-like deaminating enzyme